MKITALNAGRIHHFETADWPVTTSDGKNIPQPAPRAWSLKR